MPAARAGVTVAGPNSKLRSAKALNVRNKKVPVFVDILHLQEKKGVVGFGK
jgi:hypothetical protein